MTPRWKIRRQDSGLWQVQRKHVFFSGPNPAGSYWLIVAEYRLWENALAHTEIA